MTKNNSNADKRTVVVLSQDGEQAGLTYPRRAAGLVKKGRARFVNDNTIRLNSVSDASNTEDIKMDNNINNTLNETKAPVQETPVQQSIPEQPINRLLFNAREWSFNKDCQKNVGSRSFMQGPDGIISEAFTIGDWGYNWTEIVTKSLILPKHTLHTFTFWLNGGENDNNNEVCRLEIIFNNDYENRYTYNLNRNFIKPLKKCRGWELYEIPFITADNEYTQLRFVAQRAYMTVLNAKPASEYADLPEILDEFEGERPQRHNIVFDDGFPMNTWYSTKALRERKIKRQLSGQDWENKILSNPTPPPVPAPPTFSSSGNSVLPELEALQGSVTSIFTDMLNELQNGGMHQEIINQVQQIVEEAINGVDSGDVDIDADDIADSIMEQFGDRLSDLTDEITNKLEDISGQLENAVDDLNDRLDELNDN
ncbi:MAG: hypothetical protein J6A19_15170 [Oscillospiraceae bacterium]|nr:hypothetical protein [Oscillospiraceae bacterium]